eukprot:2263801-Prymnesium_polylepis.1
MPLILERREHPGTFLGVACPFGTWPRPAGARVLTVHIAHVSGPEGVRLNVTMAEADHPARRLR